MIKLDTIMINKFKTILRTPKYLLIIVLVMLILILAFVVLKVPEETKPNLTEPSLFETKTQIKTPQVKKEVIGDYQVRNIRFDGQAPSFPQELPLFEVEKKENLDQKCQEIVKNFSLEPVSLVIPDLPTKIWKNDKFSLVCSYKESKIHLTPLLNLTYQQKPDLDSAKEAARIFSSEIDFDLNEFVLQNDNIEYYQVSKEAQTYLPSTPEESNLFNLRYQKTINSWPIFHPSGNFFPLEILVGPDNLVAKFIYYPSLEEVKEKENYSLISVDRAIAFLNKGEGGLISLLYIKKSESGYGEIPLDIENVKSASLNQVQLVYFYMLEENLFIPSYIFSGTGVANNGQSVFLSLFIPALEPQYLAE